ncbi:MAG: V-type ATP synthase subunit I [Ruthenibacterium lactatiformans]
MGMVKMKHINIYGPEQDPQQTLEVLAKLACFHPDKDAERINAAAGAAENLYTPLLASTLGLIKDVGGDPALQEYRGRFFEYGAVKDEVEALSAQVAERGKRQAEISAKLATYAQTKTQLYHLTGLHTSVDEIFACKYLKVRFGRIPKDSYLKLPYYDDHSFTFSEYDFDGEYYWGMYFVPESHAKEVDDIFASLYFERMWVPDFVHGTPQDALAQIMTQESELQAEQKELDNMSDIAAPADIERLREYASWLNYEMQIFDMRKYVITLEHTYYISGYVPESDVERLKQGLLMVHGVKACEDDEADAVDGAPDRQPPVKLKNNWFARPFEMFITMYGLPGYGDLDPTGFVAVTYALLFGIMFGDVGQGVLLGLIAYFVMWKKMHMELGRVVARCSVFSVIFGFCTAACSATSMCWTRCSTRWALLKAAGSTGSRRHQQHPHRQRGGGRAHHRFRHRHGHHFQFAQAHHCKDHLFRKRRFRAGVLRQSHRASAADAGHGASLRGQRAVSYPVHRGAVLPDVLCRAAERAVRRRKARGLGGRYPSQWFF